MSTQKNIDLSETQILKGTRYGNIHHDLDQLVFNNEFITAFTDNIDDILLRLDDISSVNDNHRLSPKNITGQPEMKSIQLYESVDTGKIVGLPWSNNEYDVDGYSGKNSDGTYICFCCGKPIMPWYKYYGLCQDCLSNHNMIDMIRNSDMKETDYRTLLYR